MDKPACPPCNHNCEQSDRCPARTGTNLDESNTFEETVAELDTTARIARFCLAVAAVLLIILLASHGREETQIQKGVPHENRT